MHKLESARGCNLNFIVKDEGLFKITGNHIH